MLVPGAEMAHEQPDKVQDEELRAADPPLEREGEEVEREHVEEQVKEIRMDEPARHRGRILLAAQEVVRSKDIALDQRLPAEEPDQAQRNRRDEDEKRDGRLQVHTRSGG